MKSKESIKSYIKLSARKRTHSLFSDHILMQGLIESCSMSVKSVMIVFFPHWTADALQIQCYQCEEMKHNDCSTPEYIVNCTVNVQDMCQKEVLVKPDGKFATIWHVNTSDNHCSVCISHIFKLWSHGSYNCTHDNHPLDICQSKSIHMAAKMPHINACWWLQKPACYLRKTKDYQEH